MLDGKAVIITGACGILGREFTRAVVHAGGYAIMADVDRSGLSAATEGIPQTLRSQIEFLVTDVTKQKSVEELFDAASKKAGRVDAVVHSAYPRAYQANNRNGRAFPEAPPEEFIENISLQLGSTYIVNQAAAKYFIKEGHGNIINISSIYGVGAPRFDVYRGTSMTCPPEYAATKAGVISLTRYLAQFLKGKNIRVNCISPGGILANQDERFVAQYREHCAQKGLLSNSDISPALLYLLSDGSSAVTGQNLVIDDGFLL